MSDTPGRPAPTVAPQAAARWLHRHQGVALLLLAYALWLANSALALVTAAEVRSAFLRLLLFGGVPRYTFIAIDGGDLVVLGLAWLCWVLYVESAYRRAAGQGGGQLRRKAARTSGLLVAILIACGVVFLTVR